MSLHQIRWRRTCSLRSTTRIPPAIGLQNNYLNSSTSQSHGNQGDIKGDWIPSEKDHFLARYSQSAQSAPNTNTFPLFFGGFNDYVTQGGVVDWTHTFGPSLVNEFRSGHQLRQGEQRQHR